jgi:hypothetical protein
MREGYDGITLSWRDRITVYSLKIVGDYRNLKIKELRTSLQ